MQTAGPSGPAVSTSKPDVIKQARRYKPRRNLTSAIRLVAKADLVLRSDPVSKRMVLEHLVMDLTTEPKMETPG
jgi:DNA polymerase III subunit delta